MSGIFDQVINYAPPSLLLGTVTYKGTWSAATNTPTLLNPPSSITNGNYYVVSAAGTQFSLSFNIGDWIISNGSAWEKVDNTDAVSSVFGRMGAVVGVSTDYSAVGITNTALGASNPSTVAATTITASSTIAATGAVTGSNLSGTNTGDQTITLTGGVTGSGTGSFAATVVTNANLTGDVTSSGNATTLTNAPVIAKVLTGYTSGTGTVAATDSILQAIQKLNGNDGTNADLTGVITSVGNATSIASQTGTGTKFVVDTSPTLVTPNIGVATGTSLAAALNGSLGATTPSTIAATTISSTTGANFATSSGSVGIGTTSPQGLLSVAVASAKATVATTSAAFLTTNDASNPFALRFQITGAAALANRNVVLQTTDVNSADGGNLVLQAAGGNVLVGVTANTGVDTGVQRLVVTGIAGGGGGALGLISDSLGRNIIITDSSKTYVGAINISSTAMPIGTNSAIPLTFLTNSSERMRIDSSGNVGIGTTSPAAALHVLSATDADDGNIRIESSGNTAGATFYSPSHASASSRNWGFFNNYNAAGYFELLVSTSKTNAPTVTLFRADTTGLAVTGLISASGTSNKEISINTTSNAYSFLKFNTWALDRAYIRAEAVNPGAGSGAGSGQLVFQLANNPTITTVGTWNNTSLAVTGDISATGRITTNESTTRSGLTNATITAINTSTAGSASPSLYIENNSDTGNGALHVYAKGSRSGTASAIATKLDGTTTDYHIVFINDNGVVGSISTNASATTYNTSSDYRLKEITGPVVNSGSFIDALKPKTGTWKVDGSKFVGFLAHEFAEVSPLSVSGEKDAVDADGNPVYQAMQAGTPEVIANLVAELQSLRKRLAALESK